MSMVINLVEDHNIYLCEGGPVYNGGVQPTPITYLTQWKIVGNSEVHGVGNLTSWKVSGNSIVDNNTILSCGDLGQDGKYHVKISNGVTVYDIPLTEPLRKVNDVADTIEFPSSTPDKALITRNLALFSVTKFVAKYMDSQNKLCLTTSLFIGANYNQNKDGNILCNKIEKGLSLANARAYNGECFAMQYANVWLRNGAIEQTVESYQSYFDNLGAIEVIYELATPTTELIDVSPFPVSATDTYTSANVVPFSAFEHTENKEIWSCGEYNAVDGKWHILVQPQGGSIADIALTEPLRKVNNVADSIEFPSDTDGKALVTRPLKSINLYDYIDSISRTDTGKTSTDGIYAYNFGRLSDALPPLTNGTPINGLCSAYIVGTRYDTYNPDKRCISVAQNKVCHIYESKFDGADDIDAFKAYITEVKPEFIYELSTPTTELVDAPQIEEADSYSCVISQGGKAVSWSSFETNSE